VPVICASDKTHLTKFSGHRDPWPLYFTNRNIQTDIRRIFTIRTWIVVGPIPCPPKGAKNIDEEWHSVVGKLLIRLRHLYITGSGLM
jgi:hypothetical protein